jgi:hypothetical protein
MKGDPPAAPSAEGKPPAKKRKYVQSRPERSQWLWHDNADNSRFKYDLTKTFDVLVGKEANQQRFTVYSDVLTQRSAFFRAARSGRWRTQPDQPTMLDDHEPEVFSVYLYCVNFGAEALQEHIDAIPVHEEGESNDDSHFEKCESRTKFLVDLYLSADKLLDPITANMAIDMLIQETERQNLYPSYNMVAYVYSSTIDESPLRRLLRDWHVLVITKSWSDELYDFAYPRAFLEDLLHEIYNLQRHNLRKEVRQVLKVGRISEHHPKDHYHQKLDQTSMEEPQ